MDDHQRSAAAHFVVVNQDAMGVDKALFDFVVDGLLRGAYRRE
jgi:hypothetical protein